MAYTLMTNVKNKVLEQGVHYLTSDYKSRNKSRPTHNGIDMIGKYMATDYIVAIADGTVMTISYDSSRGNYVQIKHTNGETSVYYHMKDNSIVAKKGSTIKAGDRIGFMGSTGISTGNHLHFGVIDTSGNYTDPLPYLEGTKTFDGSTPTPEPTKTSVKYQAYDNTKKTWLGIITDYNTKDIYGYAGNKGHSIGGIKVRLTDGSKVTVQSHIKGGDWLAPITKWDDTSMGYSGIKGQPIDKFMIKAENHTVHYRAHTKNGKWYAWITDFNPNDSMGYAGVTGKEIDMIQIYVD